MVEKQIMLWISLYSFINLFRIISQWHNSSDINHHLFMFCRCWIPVNILFVRTKKELPPNATYMKHNNIILLSNVDYFMRRRPTKIFWSNLRSYKDTIWLIFEQMYFLSNTHLQKLVSSSFSSVMILHSFLFNNVLGYYADLVACIGQDQCRIRAILLLFTNNRFSWCCTKSSL